MNVAGERIVIFGDSTSHHGADNAPEIWDVDAGSNRVSGQPGDLLASMLLERGAEAVRVNARVGRSAFNFFGREAFQPLLDSDAAFAPTKVFVVLGTNDIGLDPSKERDAFELIKGFYEKQGAEVWAIGPWTYTRADLNAGAVPIVELMQSVFGARFIDGRPLSVQTGRAGDGVHFGAGSAAQTAQNMMQAIDAASAGLFGIKWGWIAAGVAAALAGAYLWTRARGKGLSGLDGYRVVYLGEGARAVRGTAISSSLDAATAELKAYKRRGLTAWIEDERGGFVPVAGAKKKPAELGELDEYCNPNSSPEAFKRCVARQKRAALGSEYVPPEDQIRERLFDEDPSSMDVAQDIALQHDIKLSEWSARDNRGTEAKNSGRFALEPGHRRAEVDWKIQRVALHPHHVGDCHAIFTGYVDGQTVKWAEDWPESAQDGVSRAYGRKGTEDQCRRFAAQEAWAVAKEMKKSLAAAERDEDFAADPKAARHARAVQAFHRALARRGVEQEPKELFGASSNGLGSKAAEFDELMESDGVDAMDVAEDFVEQNNLKLSRLTAGSVDRNVGWIRVDMREQEGTSRKVWWQIDRDRSGDNRWKIRTDILWDKGNFGVVALEPETFVGTAEQARRYATANAWAFTRQLRALPKTATIDDVREAATLTSLTSNISRKDHLYGLGNPDWKPITKALKAKHFKKAAKLWRRLHDRYGFVEAPAATKKALDALETHERAAYDILIAKSGLGARYAGDSSMSKKDAIREYHRLLKDPDPAAMEIAQDLVLQYGLKLSELSVVFTNKNQRSGAFKLDDEPSETATRVDWKIEPYQLRDGSRAVPCNIEIRPTVDGELLSWENEPVSGPRANALATALDRLSREQATPAGCAKIATAEAWAVAKALKHALPIAEEAPPERRRAMRRDVAMVAVENALTIPNNAPHELFGLGTSDELKLADRRKFREIIAEPGIDAMDVAEDFAEERGLKLRDLTAANYSQGTHGTIAIYRGMNGVYNVWWDVQETTGNKPGKYVAEWDILWDSTRVDLPTVLKPAYFDTLEEAQWAATANAWSAARVLRKLNRHVSAKTVATQLKNDLELGTPEGDRAIAKQHLFGR